MVGLWLMFFRVLVRAFTKSSVVRVMAKSGPLLTESLELVDSLCGIGSLGVNGLLGVSGLSVGEGVSPGVLSGDGFGVSPGIKSLSSSISKGENFGSTGITLLGLPDKSVGGSDFLLISLSLFSCSSFSSAYSLSLC